MNNTLEKNESTVIYDSGSLEKEALWQWISDFHEYSQLDNGIPVGVGKEELSASTIKTVAELPIVLESWQVIPEHILRSVTEFALEVESITRSEFVFNPAALFDGKSDVISLDTMIPLEEDACIEVRFNAELDSDPVCYFIAGAVPVDLSAHYSFKFPKDEIDIEFRAFMRLLATHMMFKFQSGWRVIDAKGASDDVVTTWLSKVKANPNRIIAPPFTHHPKDQLNLWQLILDRFC